MKKMVEAFTGEIAEGPEISVLIWMEDLTNTFEGDTLTFVDITDIQERL